MSLPRRELVMTTNLVYLEQLRRSLVIAKKDLRIYYSKAPVVLGGLLIPAFLFLAFSIGKDVSLKALVPGLLGITVFAASTSLTPVVAPWETMSRTLERLISCPISTSTIIFGDMLASCMFGLAICVIPILVGVVTGVSITYPLVLAVAILLATLCFSSLGLMFSSPPTGMPQSAQMLSAVVRFPLIFISGIFTPLAEMATWGRGLAAISPLTYFTDLARHCLEGISYHPLWLDLLVLLIFTVLFLVVAMKLHERSMLKRL